MLPFIKLNYYRLFTELFHESVSLEAADFSRLHRIFSFRGDILENFMRDMKRGLIKQLRSRNLVLSTWGTLEITEIKSELVDGFYVPGIFKRSGFANENFPENQQYSNIMFYLYTFTMEMFTNRSYPTPLTGYNFLKCNKWWAHVSAFLRRIEIYPF